MSASTSFGAWLKQRRKSLDLTQDEFARQIGCTTSLLQKIESGERRPSRQITELLADILDIAPDKHSAFVEFARADPSLHVRRSFLSPSNLPAPTTPLIGREGDVATVRQRLLCEDTRLLTLVGPPGVGKTRLSLQVAIEVRDSFDDGVFFVELAPIADPDLVASTIAQTFNLLSVGIRSPREQLMHFLPDKQMLLVLDNFEQVVTAASLVADLLAACPWLRLLVTSRIALRVRGERQFPVSPLALPDLNHLPSVESLARNPAVALFLDRCQAVYPDFSLTEENAALVTAICSRLDGLPLALELVAARINVLSLPMLLSRLGGDVLLRSDGLRAVADRQRTLYAAISTSYALLSENEKRLFAQLSVFVGGWQLETAEAIAGDPSLNVLNGLNQLISQSLVQRRDVNGEPRFSMLATIREYASERLEASGEADAIRRRHAEHYLALAEGAVPKWQGADQLAWFDRFEIEHDNVRCALSWSLSRDETDRAATLFALRLAGAMSWFWGRRCYLTEGFSWLNKALARSEMLTPTLEKDPELAALRAHAFYGAGALAWLAALRTHAFYGAGALAWLEHDLNEARVLLAQSVGTWQLLGLAGEQGSAYAQSFQSLVERDAGNQALSLSIGTQSVATLRRFGDEWGLALALVCVGSAAVEAGDVAAGNTLLEESVKLFRKLNDEWGLVLPLIYLMQSAFMRGDYVTARSLGEESLALARRQDNRLFFVSLLSHLGNIALCQLDEQRAFDLFMECLTEARERKDTGGIVLCLAGFAGVAGAQRKPERAARLLGAAEALFQTIVPYIGTAARVLCELSIGVARTRVDERGFVTAWTEGQAMGMEQAIAYALMDELLK